ncbi:hypothetical protein [Variovorax atrisoli]|uniref:hypothetical protein n=1 Tax=Variovorax atrisoli TaxID=3394203 RepID=UPI000477A2A1|nr:hypothetical protein [Variovorax paradoxus]
MQSPKNERPILFSAPMVRALLDGTKTQTRRIMKVQPPEGTTSVEVYHHPDDRDGRPRFWSLGPDPEAHGATDYLQPNWAYPCPYGQPGDRLWVRESWAEVPRHDPSTDEFLPWREDGRILVYAADPQWEGARQFLCADGVMRWVKPQRWTPSIHMPRWASRICLEVTGVRVERLQDISEADARAEGARECDPVSGHEVLLAGPSQRGSFVLHYRDIWEQINGAGSWNANPWVWVIEFRRAA